MAIALPKILFALLGFSLLAMPEAFAAGRVALVIGNASYSGAAALKNTVNDARAIAESLKTLDFTVSVAIDVDRRGAIAAIDEFSRNLVGAEIAFLFYAGHGIQIGGQNFLLPTDVDVSSERALRYSAIDIQEVVAEMERRAAVTIVALDACRDNPYLAELVRSTGGTRSTQVERGLGPMRLTGRGAVIAYAAAAGDVAADGQGEHSPYTEALLEEIDEPGVEIGLMFRRVAGRVIDTTRGVQRPELLVRLVDEVYLKPGVVATALAPTLAAAPSSTTPAEPIVVASGGTGETRSSTAPGTFFGNRILHRPAWVDTVTVPPPLGWTSASATRVAEAAGNDTYGQAQLLPLAADLETRIQPRGDADWFRVEVPAAGELSLVSAASPAPLDLAARVWNADHAVVRDWQVVARAGAALDFHFALPAKGTYWIELADSYNDAESADPIVATLNFIAADDPLEPNNQVSIASPLPLGAKLRPAIYPVGDADWYRAWVSEPGLLTVSITGVPTELDIATRLWDLNGNVKVDWQVPPRPGGDTRLQAELSEPGLYSVEVADSYNDKASLAGYDFSLDFQPVPDKLEPNNGFGLARPIEPTGLHAIAIFPRNDTDWMSLDVDHPGELKLMARKVPQNIDLYMRVWDADKNVLRDWFGPLRVGGDVEDFADLPRPGRYFVEISDGSNDASSPDLFEFESVFTPQADQYEPNNGFADAAALTPAGTIAFNILPRGDTDWFRIDVPSAGELALTIDEGPENLDLNYRVWNADRQVVIDWVPPFRKGGLTEGFADLAAAGTYFVEVSDGYSDARSVEPATLTALFAAADDPLEPNNSFGNARPLPLATAHLATILPRGDADWYLLEAPRAGHFLVTVDEVDPGLDIFVRLWNAEAAAGNWVGPPRPGGVTEAELSVPGPGLYRLEVADGNNDARSPKPFRIAVDFR